MSSQNDDRPVPGDDGLGGEADQTVRAAFRELQASAHRVDPGAALPRVGAVWAGAKPAALVPVAIVLVVVAAIGIGVLVTRGGGPEQVTTDGGDPDDGVPAGTGEPADGDLEGSWTLTDGVRLVDGWPVTLVLEGDRFFGTSACNSYGGQHQIAGSSIGFGEVGATAIGCESEVMESEQEYLAALASVESFALDGGRLTLRGTGVELVFERATRVETSELVDVTWLLVELVDDDVASSVGGTGAHLHLASDGTVDAGTGCRSLSGTWQLVGDHQILFPDLAADGSCSAELADQDNYVIGVLGDGFTAQVDGDRLTVTSSGNEGLVFRRATGEETLEEPTSADQVGFAFDETLIWSVILVAEDDVLNVRAGPGVANEIVGELEPGEQGIVAGTEVVDVDGGRWRQVHTASIPGGWVNEAFLTAQPVDATAIEVEALSALVVRLVGGELPAELAGSGEGVWVGGIGVYADFPFPVRFVSWSEWGGPVDFTPQELLDADQDCPECSITPRDFLRLPPPGTDYEIVVDADLLAPDPGGGSTFQNGFVADLQAMWHLTVDVPASAPGALDWQRIHFFFDWRGGAPSLRAVYTWGWTP